MTTKPHRSRRPALPAAGAKPAPRPSGKPAAKAAPPAPAPVQAAPELYLVCTPGLEDALVAEAKAQAFRDPVAGKGGVTVAGAWPDAWRANLVLRGATRVLVRIAAFRALHVAQLDKRARKVDWASFLRPDVPFRVEASCRASRIYHEGAAAQRIARAIHETVGAPEAEDAPVTVKARIDDDLCTISLDTSGESLHKRGSKQAVAKAPLRETMAALFLRQCGFDGREPVVDPMCGSGTFVIEAAEIAAGLAPGRARRFAFEQLANFDAAAWQKLRDAAKRPRAENAAPRCFGSDRDAGAVASARANAERAGVAALSQFTQRAISDLVPPEGAESGGLVIVNPPYGGRIGERGKVAALYQALGQVLASRFAGWRVGLVTNDAQLVAATGLPFAPASGPISHGGIKVVLYRTPPLP
jgi:putative N6-adenine-specific DNA methylase